MHKQTVAIATAVSLLTTTSILAFDPDPALVEAATQQGRVVIYTANQLESEQELAEAFNARFPGIEIEIVRAPGSRLVARVEAEAASGQLGADIMEFSDVGLALAFEDLFADYAPPNSEDYPAEIRALSPKLWPKTSWAYVLAYNSALVSDPPQSWAAVSADDFDERLGWIPAGAGGTVWTLSMFQRQALGEEEWARLAAKQPVMFPSDAPLMDALIRGEVWVAPLKTNTMIPPMRDGAPLGIVYPEDGVPITVSAAGIAEGARNPDAARLFLDWILSDEGQGVWVETSGGVTMLANGQAPEGADEATNYWLPDLDQYLSLRDAWVEEWNTVFNYRQ